jgi:hypothetical protein
LSPRYSEQESYLIARYKAGELGKDHMLQA